MHRVDNADGTYANPIMPNGHWSDPNVVRFGEAYYCMTSSIDTCPLMQLLESRDLVHWTVVGSVFRQWPEVAPTVMNWSPRLAVVQGRLRVYFHNTMSALLVAEAEHPTGPWRLLDHDLQPHYAGCDHAATVFTDDDGQNYLVCFSWIQPVDAAALRFTGPRVTVASGFLENPWLIKKDGWYYYFTSENGATTWGLADDRGKISCWRSRNVLGPYEKSPVQFLRGNLRFQAVNSGGPVLGPDGQWYYLYNAFDAQRLSLCRQLMLDPIRWTEDGWPLVNEGRGPGERYPLPIPGERARWRPALSDEFTAPTLEGVDGGVLGSKWLFKREDPANWSLTERPDWLRLRTACPGLDNWNIANFLCQRPNSAYYELDTCLEFTPNYYGQYAGLAVRELQSQATIAIGLLQTHVRSLCVWHHPGKARVQGPGGLWGGNSGLKLVAELPWFNTEYSPRGRIYLRILAEGLSYRAFYREAPDSPWIQAGGTYGLAWDNSSCWFTAFHPGLFAAEFIPTPRHGHADFDWFRCRDMEGEC